MRRSAAKVRRAGESLTILQHRFPDVMTWAGFPGDLPQPVPAAFPTDPKVNRLSYFFDYARWLRSLSAKRRSVELERVKVGDVTTEMPRAVSEFVEEFNRGLSAVELEYFNAELRKKPLKPGQKQRLDAEDRRKAVRLDPSLSDDLKHRATSAEARAKVAETELRELKKKLEASRSAQEPIDLPNPKLAKTYQKLILGMALDKFNFRPGVHNSAAENIRSALLRQGLTLDTKTIRTRLAEAFAAIGDELER